MRVIPGRGIIGERSFQPTERKFGNFLDAYLSFTEDNEASERVHLWTGISIIAGALERKVWMPRKHHTIFPNLYIIVVGPPGVVRKSTSTGIGVNLLRKIPEVRFTGQRVTDASLVDSLQKAKRSFHMQGRDLPHSSVFTYAPELSTLLQDTHGIVVEYLTDLFDCGPRDSSIPWVRETKGEGRLEVFGPCINLLGCGTKNSLARCISVDQMEGGFASRILFVVETEGSGKIIPIPEDDPKQAQFERDLLNDLMIIHDLHGQIVMDRGATELYKEWYKEHKAFEIERSWDTRFSGYYGRKNLMVEKLAIVASVAESSSMIIRAHHITFAVKWLEALEAKMFTLFDGSGRNPLAPDLRRIHEYFKRRGGTIAQSELQTLFWRDLGIQDFSSCLNQLVQLGQIELTSAGKVALYQLVPDAEPF